MATQLVGDRSTSILIREHGKDAALEAARRADGGLDAGEQPKPPIKRG